MTFTTQQTALLTEFIALSTDYDEFEEEELYNTSQEFLDYIEMTQEEFTTYLNELLEKEGIDGLTRIINNYKEIKKVMFSPDEYPVIPEEGTY